MMVVDKRPRKDTKEEKNIIDDTNTSNGATKIINKKGNVKIVGDGEVTKVIDNRPYLNPQNRPSFRKGKAEEVFAKAKGKDGLVRDPLERGY